ncbi:MAG TPA: hypothetical protein VGP72_12070 [Planctomycetota bacterium]
MRTAGVVALLAAVAGVRAAEWIDTDFNSAAFAAVHDDSKEGRITGALPKGWGDNSGWAKVWVDFSRAEEAQKAFLRVNVTRCENGMCQFAYMLPTPEGETYLHLTVSARSRTGARAQFGVRLAGAPYHFLWDATPALKTEWRDFSYDFRLDKSAVPIGLWINIQGTGQLDLASFKLAAFTREEFTQRLAVKAEGEPSNLIRNSRMPLGLQSGWSLSRDLSDGDEVEVDSDEKMLGPSGAPSLRLRFNTSLLSAGLSAPLKLWSDDKTSKTIQIYSEPFGVVMATEPHVASIFLRGSDKGKLSVVCDGRTIAQKPFDLGRSNNWQRVDVGFKPMLLARAYGLLIECAGKFWLDGLQVERGQAPTEYHSQAACEVALGCASPARVQFDDEEAEISYCVTGEPERGTLKAKVVNVYGEEKPLPDVTLTRKFLQPGRMRYDVFSDRPLGPFRIEVWVENAKHERISPYNELVIYRLRRPRYWGKDAPNSPFGTHTLSVTRHILMAKAAGINWTRLHDAGTEYIGWYHLERNRGEWTFHDKELDRYRKHGLKILGALSTAPEWATGLQRKHSGYGDRYYEPKDFDDFANYVRTVTKRYKGVIDSWDVWNEPWGLTFWHVGYDPKKSGEGYFASDTPAADYARLMGAAHKAAHGVDKELKVLGFNTMAGGDAWTREIQQNGGVENSDVICYHHYASGFAGGPDDIVELGWKQAVGALCEVAPASAPAGRDAGTTLRLPPKPVWMSEGSATAGSLGSGLYKHTVPYANDEDAIDTSDRLARFVVALLGQNVKKVFLYSMHGHNYFGPKYEWRALVTEEGYLHPCAAAHSALAWQLEDTKFVRREQIADGVTGYFFEGKERAVAVLSSKPGRAAFELPKSKHITYTDLFGNPLKKGQALESTLVYATAKELDDLRVLKNNP